MGKTAADATDAAAELGLAGFKQAMTRQIAQWTLDVFGEAATNALFATTSGGAAAQGGALATDALQLGGTLGTALGWVMTAYMVYTIAVILVQLLWECEQDEFELGAKRELKSCHYVGSYCASDVLGVCIERRKSYCCFTTPLARILNEQVRPQLGRTLGVGEASRLRGHRRRRAGAHRLVAGEPRRVAGDPRRHRPLPDARHPEPRQPHRRGQRRSTSPAPGPTPPQRSSLRADGLDQGQIRQDAGQELWGITLPTLP